MKDVPRRLQEDSESSPFNAADESPLRDYWSILLRRRLTVAGVVLATLLVALIYNVVATPIFDATTTLKVERQSPEVLGFSDILANDPAGYKDFYQTEYKILQSRAVLDLAIEDLALHSRPSYASRKVPAAQRIARWMGLGSARDPRREALAFLDRGLVIAPIRNSFLIRVSFSDADPELARDISRSIARSYQRFHRESSKSLTGEARDFLADDVARVQIELTTLEMTLQEYAESKGILAGSDDARDISVQALSELQHRYTDAQARLAGAEAEWAMLEQTAPLGLEEVAKSPLIDRLRQEQSRLEQRRSELAKNFKPSWPEMANVQAQLDSIEGQLAREATDLVSQVRENARTRHVKAASEVAGLGRRIDDQKAEVQRVNTGAISFARIRQEIDTKREVLSGLVARQNETESSFRLKATDTNNVRIVDPAELPERPATPRRLFNMILAGIFGLLLGAGVCLILDQLDNTVNSETEVTRYAGIPVLGHIPLTRSIQVAEDSSTPSTVPIQSHLDIASHLEPRSGVAEAFRNLRTSVLLAMPHEAPRHILTTSCEPGDGKSTVAINLAIVLTQLGRRVLLIDADLRRPRIHSALGMPNSVGLSSCLTGNGELHTAMQEGPVEGLSVLTSGPIPPNPSELLGSTVLRELLTRCAKEENFDHVIFDSPPMLSVTDSHILSSIVDATILVVRAHKTIRDGLRRCSIRLHQGRAHVVGAVLNAVAEGPGYYYRDYAQGYGHENEPAKPNRSVRLISETNEKKRAG